MVVTWWIVFFLRGVTTYNDDVRRKERERERERKTDRK